MNSDQNKYKKYLNKKVNLVYRAEFENKYGDLISKNFSYCGIVTKINNKLLFFEPFELNPLPIIFSQIIEIKEIL